MNNSDLLTRAELTDYKETSLYKDVVDLSSKIAERSEFIKLQFIGKSHQGRDIPLLIISTAKIFSPEEAIKKGMLRLFIMCNIHAGEVEGKEAVFVILREFLEGGLDFDENVVLIILPLFNIDGNEKIDPENRVFRSKNESGQFGPETGVGTRYTAEGLNLNRDYTKAESNEMKIMNREVYYKWLPHLTVDCHTTNGSYHGFELTYGTAMNYTGEAGPIDYVRTKMLPTVSKSLFDRTGLRTFFYGNFINKDTPESGWRTYSHLPRYGSNYRGLTNRLDILLETYSYLPFKERIITIKEILIEIIKYSEANKDEMMRAVQIANKKTIEKGKDPAGSDLLAIRYETEPQPYDEPAEIVLRPFKITTEFDSGTKKTKYSNFMRSNNIERVKTKFYGWFKGEKFVKRPFAYVIPKEQTKVIGGLKEHNIITMQLIKDSLLEVETYTIKELKKVPSMDYGDDKDYKETILTVINGMKQATFKEGDIVVPMSQELGNLVVYLLEPESDDGYAAWNFFELKEGGEYPVYRVLKPVIFPAK